MAILLYENSKCFICNEVMHKNEDITSFPAIFVNEKLPLYSFNDASCHTECLIKHPHAKKAVIFAQEFTQKSKPENRKCEVCDEILVDYLDYFGTNLIDTRDDGALKDYNWLHFHKSCIEKWNKKSEFVDLLNNEIIRGELSISNLNIMLDILNEI